MDIQHGLSPYLALPLILPEMPFAFWKEQVFTCWVGFHRLSKRGLTLALCFDRIFGLTDFCQCDRQACASAGIALPKLS